MALEDSAGAKRAPEKTDAGPAALSPQDLKAQAAHPGLSEDAALALLKRPDLAGDVLEALARNGNALRQRKVKLALVQHPRTPRQVSLPLVRQLYIFELMQVALTPAVPADVKRAADDVLLNHLETVTAGERLTLAHRGSGRLAEELLLDEDARVAQGALQNPRLTEVSIVRALRRPEVCSALVDAICRHPQWSLRREVRIALLRHEKTPAAHAVEYARMLPPSLVREILQTSRLPAGVKSLLLKELQERTGR
jgi:hypothetical protein